MGVIRVEHNANYTTMSNRHLRDERLSLRAMGLMSKMLSLPDDWDYTVAGLVSIVREGRHAVREALIELEAAGYLVREQGRSAGGNFAAINYTLFESPQEQPLTENPSTDEPSTDPPLSENRTSVNPSDPSPLSDFPTSVNPTSEKPTSVNRPQLNNLINKETKKQKHAPAAAAKWEPDMFERFWKAYPSQGRKDKVGARREWDRLKPDRKLMQVMSAALERAKTSDTWQRGIGIPYACRWLSHRRWEDVPDSELTPLEDEPPERRLAGDRC